MPKYGVFSISRWWSCWAGRFTVRRARCCGLVDQCHAQASGESRSQGQSVHLRRPCIGEIVLCSGRCCQWTARVVDSHEAILGSFVSVEAQVSGSLASTTSQNKPWQASAQTALARISCLMRHPMPNSNSLDLGIPCPLADVEPAFWGRPSGFEVLEAVEPIAPTTHRLHWPL